jgi:FtsH-binding integral membrane protein
MLSASRGIKTAFSRKYAWIIVGAVATLVGGWLVISRPEEAPELGGVPIAPALYYLQWIIYAAIIVLLGVRIMQYRRTRTPRQDLGFVFVAVVLYTVGFMLHYTPFVYEYPEGPLAGAARAGVMVFCGVLGATYGLSSTHRWY